jgi:uncharacterized protein YndB with AHSA1/START domain
MKKKTTIIVKVARTIPAPPGEVFDSWLNPKSPGTPWSENDELIFHPKIDGLFYWLIRGHAHYGRFTEIKRPGRIQHTWVSPSTSGLESVVTLTFKKKKDGTLMTLTHSGLPNDKGGKGHEGGWNYFMDKIVAQWGTRAARRRK